MALAHGCTAHCTPPEHCDLVYTGATVTEGHLAQIYGYRLGVRVLRAEPAREAPPLRDQDPRRMDRLSGSRLDGARAWLVYWRD